MRTQTPRYDTSQPDEDTQPSLTARLPEIVAQAAWRHRWRLAPVYLASCTAVGVGAGHGLGMAGGLTAAAGVMEVAARTGVTGPEGRMLLSVRERRMAVAGLAGMAGWAGLVSAAPGLPWFLDAGLMAGILALPARAWLTSRRRTEPQEAPSPWSPMAQAVLSGWATEISVGDGPRALRWSVPIEDSISEPADGALVMNVQLAHGVHSADAVRAANRRAIEALYELPENTVRLETVRDKSTQIRVVLTPGRHLEREGGMDWPGPVLLENGMMPLAECADGSTADIPLHDDSGVKHGFISGTTGSGKSVSTAAVVLPGVVAGLECVFYIDGKAGTSSGVELDPALTRTAVTPQQWMAMIEMVHRIMLDRKTRRGRARLKKWVTGQETDPIITLLIDEATTVNEAIGAKHARMVAEIAREGRVLGVRLIEVSQSPSFEDLIGGVQVRNLMTSGGFAICHRAGGAGASRLTLDSASGVDIDLRGLPKGQAAVLVEGQLAGFPAQVRYATDDLIVAALEGHITRELAGADLVAAGSAYAPQNWATFEQPEPLVDDENDLNSTDAADDLNGVQLAPEDWREIVTAWVVTALKRRGPLTAAALGAEVGLEEPIVLDTLSDLIRAELVVRGGEDYVLAPTLPTTGEGAAILARLRTLQQIASTDAIPDPAGGDDDLPTSRRWVLDQLAHHPDGLTLGQLQDLAKQRPGAPSRRTISNALADLMGRRQVSKAGAVWTPAEATSDHDREDAS